MEDAIEAGARVVHRDRASFDWRRVLVRIRVRCFVVTGEHKGVLCVRQCCGRRR